MRHALLASVLLLALPACVSLTPTPTAGTLPVQQEVWWTRMRALCGKAYPGRLVEGTLPRDGLGIRVGACGEREMAIHFDMGTDRSRTWRVIRRADGLQLTHDHRAANGTPGDPTGYGGATRSAGSAARQDFFADAHTAAILPAAARNVWTLELNPGRTLGYSLARDGSERRTRVEFDLRRPTPAAR
jgi:hypothetical protein